MEIYIGFDSAWTDNLKAPGAVCAVVWEGDQVSRFHPPRLATFDQALAFVKAHKTDNSYTLLAIDQPTIVANKTGMRPVERVAASPIGFSGGGVQPSNTGNVGMFCAAAPIWRFKRALGAREDPELGRTAAEGLHIIEVFPALALLSFNDDFFGQGLAPRYNPSRRKTFSLKHWADVAGTATKVARSLRCYELADWCQSVGKILNPKKSDQDFLDAALCTLFSIWWRRSPRENSTVIGDQKTGYIVAPVTPRVRERLKKKAFDLSVPIDTIAS